MQVTLHGLATAVARPLSWCCTLAALAALGSCGGADSGATARVLAFAPHVSTPFVREVRLTGVQAGHLVSVRYTIAAKAGAVSKPVSVTYGIDALARRGLVDTVGDALVIPVFGLYADHANQVAIELARDDTTRQTLSVEVATEPYVDPNGLYDRPRIVTARAPGRTLGFDYLALKNSHGGPIVIDTDGAIRWVAPAVVADSLSTLFHDNGFTVGASDSTVLTRFELDGSVMQTPVNGLGYTNFHHNIDPGKVGLLVEPDRLLGGVQHIESVLAEVSGDGTLIHEWDFAAIFAEHMRSRGDDPGGFVRPGIDWLHMNAAAYDPNDDSIVVSSRENFVVKVDYASGAIKWILGDPTKHWYSFASLREKAVVLPAGDLYPIGQHAVSITAAGALLLFNNGLASLNQPAGTAAGESRTYSAVSTYTIDTASLNAREVARFDNGQTILSDICSSAYQANDGSLLVNYAVADGRTHTRVVGLDASRSTVFDFEYPTTGCATSWNAVVVPFEQIEFR